MNITIWKRSKEETEPPKDLNLVVGQYQINFVLAIPKLMGQTAADVDNFLNRFAKPRTVMGKVIDVQRFDVLPIDISTVPFIKRSILPADYYRIQGHVEVITNILPIVIVIGVIVGIASIFGFLSFLSVERTVRFGKPLIAIPIALVLVFLLITIGPTLSQAAKPKVATA